MSENFKQRLNQVRAFAFDMDGVFTDGKITFLSNGMIARSLNTKDSYAINRAVKAGFPIAIITYARDQVLKDRLLSFGINEVYLACTNKEENFKEFATVYGLEEEAILYMGDDMPDLGALKRSGVPTCPYDAVHEVRESCIYISPFKGGDGCVRDVIEQVLRLKGQWS
jgi:3-deoxy-D-manno-octulosonate 8-phosphate phosphatase (KDO 8-P phosphatase)